MKDVNCKYWINFKSDAYFSSKGNYDAKDAEQCGYTEVSEHTYNIIKTAIDNGWALSDTQPKTR